MSDDGFRSIASGSPIIDTDQDGIPDYFETAIGSSEITPNHNDAVNLDSFVPVTPAGYTLMDEYLHFKASPHVVMALNSPVDVDLRAYTAGFTVAPVLFTVLSAENFDATLLPNGHTVRLTPPKSYVGRGQFEFQVSQGDGTALTQTVLAIASASAPGSSIMVSENGACRVLIPAAANNPAGWREAAFDDSTWTHGLGGIGYDTDSTYDDLIQTDIEAEMSGQNTSLYARFPFVFDDSQEVNSLILRIKYDDGFVAYLNGTEVARGNAPTILTRNSPAIASRSDSAVVNFEFQDITAYRQSLIQGTNVLAIHGLNATTDSSDMLILPELIATQSSGVEPPGPPRLTVGPWGRELTTRS